MGSTTFKTTSSHDLCYSTGASEFQTEEKQTEIVQKDLYIGDRTE